MTINNKILLQYFSHLFLLLFRESHCIVCQLYGSEHLYFSNNNNDETKLQFHYFKSYELCDHL